MFLWIRDQKWLPAISVSLSMLLVTGGLDLWLQGIPTLITAFVINSAIAFSRSIPWLAIGLCAVGLLLPNYLGLEPQVATISAVVALFIMSAFAEYRQRIVALAVVFCFTLASLIWFFVTLPKNQAVYGIKLPTLDAKVAVSVLTCFALVAICLNAWVLGRLLFTRITHVGTDIDVALLESQLIVAQDAVSDQERRIGIAKDVSELLMEQISGTMVSAESSTYALKSDPSIAPRVLSSLHEGLKKSFAEIRRLADLFAIQEANAVALPGLRDLNGLYVSYRQQGYGLNVRETGNPIALSVGAELVIYRVIQESLKNTRKHAPEGTGVDIDLIWQGSALQVLIKDNGEETRRKLAQDESGYTVTDDQKALVEHIEGPGLTAMAERVSLYEGIIEFAKVPGVGFTVSASFPNVIKFAKGN